MAFELLKQEIVETAEVLLGKPLDNCDYLLGMRYRLAISLILLGGFLFGGILFQLVAVAWCPPTTHDGPEPGDVAFTLGRWSFLVVIEIHSDRFVVRGPVSPFAVSYELNDECRIVTRFKDFRNVREFGKGDRSNRVYSLHYIRPDKSEQLLHKGWGPPTWEWAARQFEFDINHFGLSD